MTNIWLKIKKVYSKKRYWALTVLVLLVLFFMFGNKKAPAVIAETAKMQDVSQTILASGIVTSNTDVNLSFGASGTVKILNVKVGDVVKKGQVLAALDQGQALSGLTSARGALLSAKAKYQKLLDGSKSQDVQVAEVAVKNAYRKMLSDGLQAIPEDQNSTLPNPIISGLYTAEKTGKYYIKHYPSSNGTSFYLTTTKTDAIETYGYGDVSAIKPTPLGTLGLYIIYPNEWLENARSESYVVEIPNVKSASYVANYNAYQAALQNKESAISQNKITNPEIDQAQADILIAQGQMESAQARFEDVLLRAPVSGTVTTVDIKLGELAELSKPVITIQDTTNLYIEANINEANITKVKLDLPSEFTIDAFGQLQKFHGSIVAIDPSATLTDGIVNYKIKSSITEKEFAVRPGMNANMKIIADTKTNVLTIPKASLVEHDGKTFVNVITNQTKNKKNKKYEEREVAVGDSVWDGNLLEVTSGLRDGDTIAVIQEKK